ncbi:unnamed protein product [Closterium sp. NIES-54]
MVSLLHCRERSGLKWSLLADPSEQRFLKSLLAVYGLPSPLQGKERFEVEPPRGPFGTEDAPAIVEAQFDERLVGCSGGVGEEEHDVVWFKLSKDSNHSCSVCSQVFKLKVVGPGGIPGHHH